MRTAYNLLEETPTTPSKNRIIPSESDAAKEQANSLFNQVLHNEVTPATTVAPTSPTRVRFQPAGAAPTTPSKGRIFNYFSTPGSEPSTPGRRLDSTADQAYALSPVRPDSQAILNSPRKQLRTVPKTPYRVLDAPELADDFYLNLVDWSSTNVLGVGLGSCVYLWTAHTAAVSKLCDLAARNDTISSVSWVQRGSTLAVGTLSGRLHIYDANKLQLLRTYQNAHTQRIGALAWNDWILTSGSRDRYIHHRDVREKKQEPFKRFQGHKQEVCGLKWSSDGGTESAYLASGGNDNKVCIWDVRGSKRPGHGRHSSRTSLAGNDEGSSTQDVPLWKFHEHTAAVKALAWDPHQANTLATGGGTQDKHIRFWNTSTGSMIEALDTGSQVCNLLWSLNSHELVSTHGFSSAAAQNQICLWKYPQMDQVASLSGHTHRVLYLAMSPDGETIVTGAGDETLRFWNAFPKKSKTDQSKDSKLDFSKQMR
ncbi:WD40 repeat-like protein [Gloeophyllum trabeum ATCC 11539]|uniref:WD40 repeat-like protein n=1 Tax=Gloeophyllum trabeum (strain ATCC 11539 / FP-39264 / Madison 617) TaxID=670483 RepID=S7RLI1_GLOTA|nr:WD40 repeat-like protein [Gloeophyllum trabeum ATCC 11539]EPQ55265.1 WD40 repeat-like protein [Gloeophyllum trabeum ATCC 11539]